MKIHFIMAAALIGSMFMATLPSCGREEKRLAREVAGVWAGTPETFTDSQAVTVTVTDTYTFGTDTATISDGKFPVGPLAVTAVISMDTQVMPEGDDVTEPLALSAAAMASARGTYSVVDDDEITLSIDPASISVNVDPEQVVTVGSPLTAASTDARINSMRPAIAANLQARLRDALARRYGGMTLMEDVKIKGNLLKYEMGHEDFTLTRQEIGLGN